MAGGIISRTAHFVLHHAALEVPAANAGPESVRSRPLFAVRDEPWVGAVVPKRWAKRAVRRNGIRRQIYDVSARFAPTLPNAAHVVRLRMGFAADAFKSAWSEPLKKTVRAELLSLFESLGTRRDEPKARPPSVIPTASRAAPAAPTIIPAKAGIQGVQK